MLVYRAVDTPKPNLLQTPRPWLRSQQWFQRMEANPTAATALAEYSPPQPGGYSLVPKGWTELAFEHVRTKLRPEAPSRLACLFGMLDPLEAHAFLEEVGGGRALFVGSVEPEVPWSVVDMSHYSNDDPPAWTIEGLKDAWDRACSRARAYWTDTATPRTTEVLIGGAVRLRPDRWFLIDTFRQLGLVE